MDGWLTPSVIWILVGIALMIAEIAAPGFIVFFFAAGAIIVGLICAVADIPLSAQLAVFLVSSVFLLVLLRRKMRGMFHGHTQAPQSLEEDMEEFVGKRARVTAEIIPPSRGRVEFNGTGWAAESDAPLVAGQEVEIVMKDNLTLRVRPLKED